MVTRPSPMGYRAALRWLRDNDDLEFMADESYSLSVSACLVADIYRRSDEEIRADLLKLIAKKED